MIQLFQSQLYLKPFMRKKSRLLVNNSQDSETSKSRAKEKGPNTDLQTSYLKS